MYHIGTQEHRNYTEIQENSRTISFYILNIKITFNSGTSHFQFQENPHHIYIYIGIQEHGSCANIQEHTET